MSGARWKGSVLAVDIGGTKVAAARVTGEGRIVNRQREATSMAGPEAVIAQLTRLLRELGTEAGADPVKAIGIGIPAVLQSEGDLVVWAPNLPGFRNVRLREAIETALGLPVCIEYDGHTAVLGEWWRGAGQGHRDVVFTIIGTGIGGGVILDGRLYRGYNRLAGAAGWFTLATELDVEDSSRCCGHWESRAAGPGVVRRAVAGLLAGQPSALSPEGLTAEQVFVAARANDPLARSVVDETARIIGIGVANIVSLLNPEIVILGGGVGRQGDLILESVRQIVRQCAQPISGRSVQIEASRLGDDAGILGAAYAAFERTQES